MNEDLSDEVFWEWYNYIKSQPWKTPTRERFLQCWRECRRLAEALERKAFEAGIYARGSFANRAVSRSLIEEAWTRYQAEQEGK
jgi:hypothetical protein